MREHLAFSVERPRAGSAVMTACVMVLAVVGFATCAAPPGEQDVQGAPDRGLPPPCSAATPLAGTLTLSPRPDARDGLTAWSFQYIESGWSTTLQGIVVKPPGSGPFAAVVVSHGGGGTAAGFGMTKAQQWFGPSGYLVIAPEYTHAGSTATCSAAGDCAGSPENVKRATRSLDILESSQLAQTIGPVVRTDRLFLYGNSMGAGVTLETAEAVGCRVTAAAITAGGLLPNLAPSGEAGLARVESPLIHLHGRLDTTVSPSSAEALSAGLARYDRVHQLVWFPNARHEVHSDPATTTVCRDFIRAWFDTYREDAAALLTAANPPEGPIDTPVELSGARLGTNPFDNSVLTFGGVRAAPSIWTDTRIVARVPPAATAGPIRVVVPQGPIDHATVERPVAGGTRSNELAFRVR